MSSNSSTIVGIQGFSAARPTPQVINASELNHERLLNTFLLERSGGWDLYSFRIGNRSMLYKHVKETAGLQNVTTLMDRWATLREDTDWVRPEQLVLDRESKLHICRICIVHTTIWSRSPQFAPTHTSIQWWSLRDINWSRIQGCRLKQFTAGYAPCWIIIWWQLHSQFNDPQRSPHMQTINVKRMQLDCVAVRNKSYYDCCG